MSTLVSIRNLHKTYRRGPETVDVLHGIDLDITKGDFVALMGPSGSGKTTLLNLIGGLDSPTRGEITVDGSRIDALGSGQLSQWRSHHVGFVFQFYNLLPVLSAQRNVELRGEHGQQVVELEHEAHVGGAPARELTVRQRVDATTIHDDASRRRRVEAADEVQERGFA